MSSIAFGLGIDADGQAEPAAKSDAEDLKTPSEENDAAGEITEFERRLSGE